MESFKGKTPQELQQEYNHLVAIIGDREYKIRLNEKQIDSLNQEIVDLMEKIDALQAEGAKLKEAEK